MKKNILLIISGSISAYKVLDLIRLLEKSHYQVSCVLTSAGEKFVTPLSVASIISGKIYNDQFDFVSNLCAMPHIDLSRNADLIVVAPATADIIGKIANGLADDLASSVLLASNKDVILAPAMNVEMWQKKSLQRNLKIIKDDGVIVINPEEGDLACGEFGIGKMAQVENIFDEIKKYGMRKVS